MPPRRGTQQSVTQPDPPATTARRSSRVTARQNSGSAPVPTAAAAKKGRKKREEVVEEEAQAEAQEDAEREEEGEGEAHGEQTTPDDIDNTEGKEKEVVEILDSPTQDVPMESMDVEDKMEVDAVEVLKEQGTAEMAKKREEIERRELEVGGSNESQWRAERRDQVLADLLVLMDDYRPIIPDTVTQYYLQRSGFDTSDVRVSRLIALSAQKFVSDIISDAFQYARTRTAASSHVGEENRRRDRARTVLTMDDLAPALAEYGVNAGRQAYYL